MEKLNFFHCPNDYKKDGMFCNSREKIEDERKLLSSYKKNSLIQVSYVCERGIKTPSIYQVIKKSTE